MQALLSDGSTATTVVLNEKYGCAACCTVDGQVWVLSRGERYVSVRNAMDGKALSRVDLMTDDAIALAKVGPRVWVATGTGKLLIFGVDGILLGVLQPTSIPTVTTFFSIGPSAVITIGGGKDFHLWDMSQFVVERAFLGRTPGEAVACVVSAHRYHVSVIAVSTASIRLWSMDGTILAELPEAGLHAVCFPKNDDSATTWVAQIGWITIFSVPNTRRSTQFSREKTIPCALVQQLFSIDARQVGALDAEGLITIWNTTTLLPMRSFKVTPQLDVTSSSARLLCLPTVERRSVSMWCCGDHRALIWDDVVVTDVDPGSKLVEETPIDMEREEIRFLRRKLKALEGMATLYRQKIGILFREKSSAPSGSSPARYSTPPFVQAFNEVDSTFAKALEAWDQETKEQEPIPDTSLQVSSLAAHDALEFTEYWKRKYYQMVEEFSNVRSEHEGLIDMINDEHRRQQTSSNDGNAISLDGRRAAFLTKVIKEKNDLRERVMQLSDDVTKLRGLLKNQALGIAGADSSLDAIDALRQESHDLRRELREAKQQLEQSQAAVAEAQQQQKQNQLLKQRVKKLRADLDIAQVQLSESSAVMQRDYQSMVDAMHSLESRVKQQESEARTYDLKRAQADLDITTLSTELTQQKQLNVALEREVKQRENVEQRTLTHLQSELTLMCQSLDDRDAKVAELIKQNHGLTDLTRELETTTTNQRRQLEAKDMEIDALNDRLRSVEGVIHDRRTYARAVDELQGRLEMVVEELRHGFTPVQFAANISELEGRISNLFALESQLRQKDDIIAMRDDEIAVLKEHVTHVEQQVQQVSSVFSQLPRSVEEVEQLLVEVDEYRRRLGEDVETQEMVQLRLLELNARRQATASAPFAYQINAASSLSPKS